MLRIENTIFSLDILEKKFCCDLPVCNGNCCRYGDSGAPLSKEEVQTLKEIWSDVKPYLRPEGIKTIEEKGTSIIDFENDMVTPLIDEKECAYAIINNGIYFCGIEKAWIDGKITFQKPVSCHLYPAKVKYFSEFIGVNYDEQPVCASARKKGIRDGIYVYEFLKEPLTRALGSETYKELCQAAEELRKVNKQKK